MWTKLGDEFPDEARDLSDAAYRTLTEAWCWSNRRLLDLTIDKRDLKRFAETANPEAAVEELVDMGWWQDLGDGRWFIGCRFSEWQRDRSQVEHRREQLAQAQKRRRRHLVGDHSLCLNCKASDESTVDATDDYGDDPGRDGTGRVRTSNYATEEKGKGSTRASELSEREVPLRDLPKVVEEGQGVCRRCQASKESWVLASRDGYCITCYQTARLESA